MILDNLSRVAIYISPKFAGYFDTITECHLKESPPKELGRYYLNFASKFHYKRFDEFNIPVFTEKYQIYHPTIVCQYAMGIYEMLHRSNYQDKELLTKFLIQADWLVKNAVFFKDSAGWKFEFPVAEYNLKAPWFSSLTQSEAISVLLRAHKLSGKKEYLELAEKALNLFSFTTDEGGIVNYLDGNIILEEYPTKEINCVLNGYIFTLFGLYDFVIYNQNPKAVSLFEEGIRSIKNIIPKFDIGYWSSYNLGYYRIASCRYHLIHIEQLKALYFITKDDFFKEYYLKWENYSSSLAKRMNSLIKKIRS